MSTSYDLHDLYQYSSDVIHNFQQIEPRPWNERILALELCAEIGSLLHAILDMEGYKRRPPCLAAVKDECADVLFIALRLAGYCGVPLPDRERGFAQQELNYPNVESIELELIQLAGQVAAGVSTSTFVSLSEALPKIAALVDSIATHYHFSLREAYLSELRLCLLWQAKIVATAGWKQRLLWWRGKRK